MDEVAEATTYTAFARVKTTAGFSKVGDGGEFAVDGATGVPAGVQGVACGLCRFLVLEAGVNVANEICLWSVSGDVQVLLVYSRSLLLSHTTTSSISPYLHISHQKSS